MMWLKDSSVVQCFEDFSVFSHFSIPCVVGCRSDVNTNLVFLRLIGVCFFPLSAGYTLCLGKSYIFRFNHPEEANRMKSMLPQKSPVSPLVYSTGNLSFFQLFQLILPSPSSFLNLSSLTFHLLHPNALRNWNHWSFVHTHGHGLYPISQHASSSSMEALLCLCVSVYVCN